MTSRQKQKSLLIDPSNVLTFNVSHASIHMKKIKINSISNSRNQSSDDLQSIPDSTTTLNTKIYYSAVEKESESGISFNDRLFFLKDQDVFGYMSKPDKNFDIKNAKETIPIKYLRRVIPKAKNLALEFEVKASKDSNKLVQKRWVLRMKDKKMVDAWTDIINYQVTQIPSRKSTIERQDSRVNSITQRSTQRKEETQTAQKTSNYFSKLEQPIANERPQQDYGSEIRRSSKEAKTPQSVMATQGKEISQSPVRDEYSNSSNEKIELSTQRVANRAYQRQQENEFNSTSKKHSQKKQRYMSSDVHLPYQTTEFLGEKSYYEEIQQTFIKKNQEMRQKLILPSFYNYFRPYIDQLASKRASVRMEVDKKYEDFITLCELTAKQLIDKTETPLNEFKLSSRYLAQKDILSKDKLQKEMGQMYEEIFGRPLPKSMELEALFLLFDNILYLSLQDVELIMPLAELKTLPTASDFANDSNASLNKICQNSLIAEFQTKQKNLQYIYTHISKNDILKDKFLIPMSCQVQYKGFTMFFRPKTNETLFKVLYDSSKEISNIQNGTAVNDASQLTLDQAYEQLASTLYVNPDVLESQNHVKIKSIRAKQNQYDKILTKNYKDFKYVITFADILPFLESKQVINPNIFIKVHQNGRIPNLALVKNGENQNSSKKINLLNLQETSFLPSVLQQKSQSIYKRKQGQKLSLYNQLGSAKQNDIQVRLYKQEIIQKIKQVSKKLDRFDVSIIHPYELNQLLRISSLNHSSLGRIYQQISGKNSFVKSIIKSQIAAECAKLVLFKKCQQLLMTPRQEKEKQRDEISMKNVTTLLNFILGKSSTKQTELIWKVLTLHAQLLYSVSVSQKEIHRGYFILALSSKLNIMINAKTSSIDDIFNHDKFIIAIKFQSCKIKPVQFVSTLLNEIQETQHSQLIKNSNSYFKRLEQTLSISSNSIPYFVKRSKYIYNKILFIFTEKISPNNLNFNHLNIYQTRQLNFTQTAGSFQLIEQPRVQTATSLIKQKQLSLKRQSWEDNFCIYFKRKLKELQYKVVERNSFNLEQQVETFMKEVKVFYEYHPLISQFLEFLSDYHLTKGQHQRAIDCLKASLSNIISVCEGNSNHVKLANYFMKIAFVYEKMRKFDEALNQLKRSKHCLEINKEDNSPVCAHLLIKIAKITLQMDGKVNESLNYVFSAQKILQTQANFYENVYLIIQAYQIESKCLYSPQFDINSLKSTQNLNRATRAQHYFETLERILIKQNEVNKSKKSNPIELIDTQKLQRIFKLVLPFYFHGVSQKGGQMLMTYMCELSENIAKRGGIDFIKPQVIVLQKPETQKLQANEEPQYFFYPISTNRSKAQQQQPNPQTASQQKKQYNFYQAFLYLKKQIYNGSLIMELMEFMEKTDQILSIIKRKIKQNMLNKSQSRSSSRVYLMSTRGADEWDAELNEEGLLSSNRISGRASSGHKEDGEDIDLEKLLDYSKEVRSSTQDAGYSQRQRKFDSVMKALMVLLGDGFMLHIFEE